MKITSTGFGVLSLAFAGVCLLVASHTPASALSSQAGALQPGASYSAFLWNSGSDSPGYSFDEEVDVPGFGKPVEIRFKSTGWFRMRSDGQIESWVELDKDAILNAVLAANAARTGKGTVTERDVERIDKLLSELRRLGKSHRWVAITE